MRKTLPKLTPEDEGARFTQGDVTFLTRYASLGSTLDAVDTLKLRDLYALARLNEIPTAPTPPRQELRWMVGRVVQRCWYLTFKGDIPDRVTLNDATAMRRYKRLLRDPRVLAETETGVATPRAPRTRVTTARHRLAKKLPAAFRGHAATIVSCFRELGAASNPELVLHLKGKKDFDTSSTVERTVSWYVADLTKKGVLVTVGEQTTLA